VVAATLLLQLALNVSNSGGGDDPEEQPQHLIGQILCTPDGCPL
jgi:hypothetical protein